ncbi:hypothetical protein FXN63_00600 [Pigmentiphaga aceris]|uniref:Uncharacterized protein n=1 Tax=Pigmentiphaga aceris TaxID=1940612 RepID=A0A5C0ASC7_9BURK|nr:hypothetical protein [Pigmentiphaga aceris]QEI04494.1 hypothetical protein FXN63_00600 [Pigmentiphaga aceris]
MAISPPGSHSLERDYGIRVTASSTFETGAKQLDWNQVLLDQEQIQARASLRPDTAASIRAAQHVWLASQDRQMTAVRAQDSEVAIEALIAMLVDQASMARREV